MFQSKGRHWGKEGGVCVSVADRSPPSQMSSSYNAVLDYDTSIRCYYLKQGNSLCVCVHVCLSLFVESVIHQIPRII
jgi:hypothetical protein